MRPPPLAVPLRTVALLGLLAHPAGAQEPTDPGAIPFEEYRLSNGLHVILSADSEATAVAVNLWYDVGSRNERPGRSGFAHLFEHLMFQGSANVGPGEHPQLVERAGGFLNASVTEDRTNYYETMPAERVNLALWLEAERMRSLQITEDVMRREIEVVKEERLSRYDNSPYGPSQLQALYEAPYDAASCFSYAHPAIGSPEDLDAAGLDDVQAFFDLYYAPNNATLVIVGAFDADEVRDLIERYFGRIPAGSEPPEVSCERPFARLPTEVSVEDPNAFLPAVFISYAGTSADHRDAPAIDLLARILGEGEISRLYQRLVREEQAAVEIGAFASPRRGPGVVLLLAIANQGVETTALVELLDSEVARVARDGVTEAELTRARNQLEAQTILERQTTMGRAEALQGANHFFGSPSAVRTPLELARGVTADDVRRAAASYLDPERRAVVRTVPVAEVGPGGGQ